ncbi:hypothetical protein FM21_17275 [Streptomyces mutabilis]|uniref:Uncharacterized protein n=1 Tax=Streptomyces mutabilis TaxID=67332 RepID=A0A086MUS8_9ACTN|nr:hypothetical protein FM21_17275 [Streptomyces mutabilis]
MTVQLQLAEFRMSQAFAQRRPGAHVVAAPAGDEVRVVRGVLVDQLAQRTVRRMAGADRAADCRAKSPSAPVGAEQRLPPSRMARRTVLRSWRGSCAKSMINLAAAAFQATILRVVHQVGGYRPEPVQQSARIGRRRRTIGVPAGRELSGEPSQVLTLCGGEAQHRAERGQHLR